ncbi:type 1 fimbrial protein [Gammaproteobacteria bacterium ESL0073]|nr:type 1 fimbrial protein [Gammaproteobacteria bacterium ESL0073]
MKKLVSGVILAAGLVPALAFAQQTPNTINFKGEVTTQTCQVSINGASTSPVVLLPTVADTALATAGTTAGDTNFTIELQNCATNLTSAKATFVGNNVQASGNLGNTGTATGVSIQVANDGGSVLDFNASDVVSSAATISGTGTASLPFTASYYAEAPATAGTVLASTQFAIVYQ